MNIEFRNFLNRIQFNSSIEVSEKKKLIDLGLIGVLPEYEMWGIASAFIESLMELLINKKKLFTNKFDFRNKYSYSKV